MDVEGSGRGVS